MTVNEACPKRFGEFMTTLQKQELCLISHIVILSEQKAKDRGAKNEQVIQETFSEIFEKTHTDLSKIVGCGA